MSPKSQPRRRLAHPTRSAWLIGAVAIASTLDGAGSSAQAQPISVGGKWLPCSVDADCGDPYLVCTPTQVYACFPVDGGTILNPPDAGACQTQIPSTVSLCTPSYQWPCHIASDCGPAGFTCKLNAGNVCTSSGCTAIAQCESNYVQCDQDSECPAGWSCYAPTGGNASGCAASGCDGDAGAGGAASPKACYPPYASFHGSSVAGTPSVSTPHAATPNDAGAHSSSDAASSVPHGNASRGGCECIVLGPSTTSTNGAWALALLVATVTVRRARKHR